MSDLRYFASDERYVGKGRIVQTEADGNLIVELSDGRRGRVAPDQVYATYEDAQAHVRGVTRVVGGWADAAQLAKRT